MCDEPARAIRTKKDSSIVVGLNLLKEGKGDAFVSAGSTGALHVGASLIVRTLRGKAAGSGHHGARQKSRLTCCWTAVPTWSAARMLAALAVMGAAM